MHAITCILTAINNYVFNATGFLGLIRDEIRNDCKSLFQHAISQMKIKVAISSATRLADNWPPIFHP